ncbi:MAG: hypothetical protein J1E04_01580 [Alistipes sp.]|nr:hypothetical protein [Alistipes sp.]
MGIVKRIMVLMTAVCAAFPVFAGDVRGYDADTLSSPVPSIEDVRGKRGLVDVKNVFVPRGQWLFSGYASYSTHKNNSYNFLVFDDIDSDGYTFKISPMIGYAIRDNMALGARFIYGRTLLKLDDGKLSLGDEDSGVNIEADYYYSLKHNYSVALVWRQYIPLGRDKRFALFSEMSLSGGGHQTKFAANQPLRGTFETGYEFSLGVSPGLIAFISNTMALEVNVGVMGLNFKHSHQVQNRVETADVNTSYMNFSVNILSIGLGVSFYL